VKNMVTILYHEATVKFQGIYVEVASSFNLMSTSVTSEALSNVS
jgi:hypothetical protein